MVKGGMETKGWDWGVGLGVVSTLGTAVGTFSRGCWRRNENRRELAMPCSSPATYPSLLPNATCIKAEGWWPRD